jgi:hypothetical protein
LRDEEEIFLARQRAIGVRLFSEGVDLASPLFSKPLIPA